MAPKVLAYQLEGFSSENEVGCHSTIEPVRRVAGTSIRRWLEEPHHFSSRDLRDSTKGPSTSTSMESSRSPHGQVVGDVGESITDHRFLRVLVECLAAECPDPAIALGAGFVGSFRQIFIEVTGITPDSVTIALQLGSQGCAGLRLFEGLARRKG